MTLDELAEALKELDDLDNGCCLHIAVTDYNLRDEDVQECIDDAKADGCDGCVRLGEALMKVPEEHRESFLGVICESRPTGDVHKDPNPWRG